ERSCLYGLLTPVNQLDWRGLYPPQETGVLSDIPVIPAYVQRTVDHDLRTVIRNALSTSSFRERLVVVTGESKAGKTRTLLEALNECCPDSRLIWLRPPDQAEGAAPLLWLADSGDAVPADASLIVVLDDLQYHCSVRTNAISQS